MKFGVWDYIDTLYFLFSVDYHYLPNLNPVPKIMKFVVKHDLRWNSFLFIAVIVSLLWLGRNDLIVKFNENIDSLCGVKLLGGLGYLQGESKKVTLSKEECKRIIKQKNAQNTLKAYVGGLLELRNGENQQALSIWKKNGQVSRLLTSQGAELVRSDDPANAKKWLQWAVSVDPENRDAWYFLSLAQRNLDQDQNALSSLKRAAQADHGTNVGKSDVYFMQGRLYQAYLNPGDWDKAWKAYGKALEFNDYRFGFLYDQTLIQRGNLLMSKNRWADAVIEYRKSLEQNLSSVLVREKIATALWELEEYDRIEEVYQEGIQLDPNSLNLRLALAEFYKKRNLDAKAAQLYQEILRLDPDNDEAIQFLSSQ